MVDARPQDRQPEKEDWEERARIERVYRAYSANPYYKTIWSGQAARFLLERKWEEIGRLLVEERAAVSTSRLLDLGAGDGADCERFRQIGFRPERIVALDLLAEYVRFTKRAFAWLEVLQGDGARLPFRDASFELVFQSTMLSSVLDRDRRRDILHEIGRVLAPDGLFISYDTRYPNPWNRNTSPLTLPELRSAFPGWRVSARSATLIPQVARLVGRLGRGAWVAIEKIPPLRSHLLAVARKP